jgi:enoyl-CoA hydratase
MTVRVEQMDGIQTVVMSRPERRNAVDRAQAARLAEVFRAFDADETAKVAVLYGEGGTFCAGADLKAVAENGRGAPTARPEGDGPLGCSRMLLSKPVIAAVEGHAVAGGLELALWCDLRVADPTAIFGVFCRRFGVPLVDGGTVRLPRIIGQGQALDMILTGRGVEAVEAQRMGLVNRLCAPGEARSAAETLAREIAKWPERCMKADRLSAYSQWDKDLPTALSGEFEGGWKVVESGETLEGAKRFSSGKGRHGSFE